MCADQLGALAHADQPEMAQVGQRIGPSRQVEPDPIVGHRHNERPSVYDLDLYLLRVCVSDDIIQRLLHNAIKREFALDGKAPRLSFDLERRYEITLSANSLGQRFECRQ